MSRQRRWSIPRRTLKSRYPRIDASTRQAVIARDLGRCRFCGIQTSHRWRPTIDHLIPQARGGGNHVDNLVVACFRCNQRKGGRTPSEARMAVLPIGTLRSARIVPLSQSGREATS